MRRGLSLRGRMVTTAVVASAVALAALLLLAAPALQRRALRQTAETLFAEAQLMARVVEDALARGTGTEALDPLIDEASRDVGARVTVIARDGRVLADSAVSGAQLAALENHAGRPEVQEALAGGTGKSQRHSATVGADLLYVAVLVRHGGQVVGVARLSRSLGSVAEQGRGLWRAAALALLLALVATGLVSVLLSAPLARSLEEMMEAARQYAGGDLATRIRVRRADELGELARIINLSADQLQGRMTELARDRARTEAILSAMDDGVLAVDHRGKVVLANPMLIRSLELRDAIGRHYLEVIRQSEVGTLIEDVLRTGARREAEVEVLQLRRVFDIAAVPFPDAEGAPHGAVLTFNDATERRRLERMRRDFVVNASHELRTPLTSIRGFVEALEDGAVAEPETAQRFLGKIRTHADRMAALVDDLLDLSRLEGGRAPEWKETRPSEVAEGVVASFAAPATRKDISLRHVDQGAPPAVTDPERLRRILENLVDNAVKYTPERGRVEGTTSPGPDGSARIEVADDGPGIAPEHQDRVFERFYRVDKARSRELGGTGLGLSIVKHLAEGIGASVTVESEPGKGSRFIVSLPGKPA